MDFSEIIDNMWDAYDLEQSGYIDKTDAMELTEGVCKNIPKFNQNYTDQQNSLRSKHSLPPSNIQNTTKGGPFNQSLFNQLFSKYDTRNDQITKSNMQRMFT